MQKNSARNSKQFHNPSTIVDITHICAECVDYLPTFYIKNPPFHVGIYTSPMDPMGINFRNPSLVGFGFWKKILKIFTKFHMLHPPLHLHMVDFPASYVSLPMVIISKPECFGAFWIGFPDLLNHH